MRSNEDPIREWIYQSRDADLIVGAGSPASGQNLPLPEEFGAEIAKLPDVEAALICRTEGRVEHFLVPIDTCYELAGRMRLYWRGFDGGEQARQSIAEFLGRVRSLARPLEPGPAPAPES